MALLTKTDPSNYQNQFDEKANSLSEQFSELYPQPWQTYPSPPSHYRARCEFGIWHQGDDLHYAMFKQGKSDPVLLDQFDIASTTINDMMPRLIAALKHNEPLRHRLFQVEFLGTLSGELLVTLIYHKKIDESFDAPAASLAAELGIKLIGRSRGVKRALTDDRVTEVLTVEGQQYKYLQAEGGFSQPNPQVAQHMLTWALECTKQIDGDLLELYCGNGNFTIPFASQFNRVLATEISKTSVKLANENFALNGTTNAQVIRMSSEEFTQAMNGDREFRRMREVALADYSFSTLFLDPPRAGLDEQTRQLARNFDNIVYISCNPDTLQRDIEALSDEYEVKKMAFFDQFPYTHHAEAGAMLVKRAN